MDPRAVATRFPDRWRRPLAALVLVCIGVGALVVAWNVADPETPSVTRFRENGDAPIDTSPEEAIGAAEARTGYPLVVPVFPGLDADLTHVRLTMPPASGASLPRTQLDFRGDGDALVLVAQGREDWLPDRPRWEPLSLGLPSVRAYQAPAAGEGSTVEYRLHVGEWRFAVLFFNFEPKPRDAEALLRDAAAQLSAVDP